MLGRGLESLIPNKSNKDGNKELGIRNKELGMTEIASANRSRTRSDERATESVFQIEIEKISVNPYQPRRFFEPVALQELASSIREYGILQPLIVSKKINDTDGGVNVAYELIAGERRLQAARLLGLQRVPAIVRSVPQEKEKLELALIENIQRENLSPMEMARAYSKLQDQFGLTQREIAARVGRSRETVANALRLLNLSTQAQEALMAGKISESQARMLLGVSDLAAQEQLFKDITQNNLSVRELRARISKINGEYKQETSNQSATLVAATNLPAALPPITESLKLTDPETIGLEDSLERALGTKVKVEKNGAEGNLIIKFSSPEELQELVKKLMFEK